MSETTDTGSVQEITPKEGQAIQLNAQTAVAAARIIVAVAAPIAAGAGWKFDADLWFNVIITALAIVAIVWAGWKNNNFTYAAQFLQGIKDNIKLNGAEFDMDDED